MKNMIMIWHHETTNRMKTKKKSTLDQSLQLLRPKERWIGRDSCSVTYFLEHIFLNMFNHFLNMTIPSFWTSSSFQILIHIWNSQLNILLLPLQWVENDVPARLPIYQWKIIIQSWLRMVFHSWAFTSRSDICLLRPRECPKWYS